jgi:hypothetical protein
MYNFTSRNLEYFDDFKDIYMVIQTTHTSRSGTPVFSTRCCKLTRDVWT